MLCTRLGVACVALFVMATPAHAQASARIGILAGMNAAAISGEGETLDRRMALVIGGYLVKPLTGGLSLRPELLYSQKGGKDSYSDEDISVSSTLKLDYLDIPILLQYEGRTARGITPHVHAGPSFAIKARCAYEGSTDGVSLSASCDEIELSPKSFDVGGLVGAGIGFPLGSFRATVGTRFQQGFSEIETESTAKHRVLSFYGTVEFGRQ